MTQNKNIEKEMEVVKHTIMEPFIVAACVKIISLASKEIP